MTACTSRRGLSELLGIVLTPAAYSALPIMVILQGKRDRATDWLERVSATTAALVIDRALFRRHSTSNILALRLCWTLSRNLQRGPTDRVSVGNRLAKRADQVSPECRELGNAQKSQQRHSTDHDADLRFHGAEGMDGSVGPRLAEYSLSISTGNLKKRAASGTICRRNFPQVLWVRQVLEV